MNQTIMNQLIELDKKIFFWINHDLQSSFFDLLMPLLTNLHKLPLFAWVIGPALVILWIIKDRSKAIVLAIFTVFVFASTDSVSHHLIKKNIERARPSHEMSDQIILRTHPHAGFSFPSNHAANMMGAATFLAAFYPGIAPVLFLYAIIIGFSRIYVGVHYPTDIIGGFLLGWLIAQIFKPIARRTLKKISSRHAMPNSI